MKMIFLVYSQATDYDVIASLKKLGIRGYTKMEKACGEGTETEPKLHTHTWPGENNVIFMAVDDDGSVPVIIEEVRRMKVEHPRAGLKAFILPMEEIV